MVSRFGILILLVLLSGCHYESVFSSNPKDSLSFMFSGIIAGVIAWLYILWENRKNK